MLNAKTAARLGWRLFAISWIPFIGIFSYVFYPVEQWLPPISIICLVISLGMMIVGIALILLSFSAGSKANRRVLETGEHATATVTSVEDSGMRVNNHFVLNVGLHVEPAFGQAFDAVASQIIPIYHMARIQKGHTVNVRYLKDTHEALIAFD